MTDKEIYIKALKKAELYTPDEETLVSWGDSLQVPFDIRAIFLRHQFAKAFWGENKFYIRGESTEEGQDYNDEFDIEMPAWQYHLQQMVIKEEPLKYLSKFL